MRMTGHFTIVCDTPEEYADLLASIASASSDYVVTTKDATARTIEVDLDLDTRPPQ